MCLLCDTTFHAAELPRCYAILTPLRDDVIAALGFGVCFECTGRAGSNDGLRGAIKAKLKADLIPGLREIPMPSEAGHA
jgi:hypothetical protein